MVRVCIASRGVYEGRERKDFNIWTDDLTSMVYEEQEKRKSTLQRIIISPSHISYFSNWNLVKQAVLHSLFIFLLSSFFLLFIERES